VRRPRADSSPKAAFPQSTSKWCAGLVEESSRSPVKAVEELWIVSFRGDSSNRGLLPASCAHHDIDVRPAAPATATDNAHARTCCAQHAGQLVGGGTGHVATGSQRRTLGKGLYSCPRWPCRVRPAAGRWPSRLLGYLAGPAHQRRPKGAGPAYLPIISLLLLPCRRAASQVLLLLMKRLARPRGFEPLLPP
jgi:hypothetical protein